MKEFTVTFNVQITKILKDADEENVTYMDDAKRSQIENIIKSSLDADDANVSDYKVFMKDETNG